MTREVKTHAGISANLGKTRVFNYEGGPAPPGIADLGPEVWRGSRPPQQRPAATWLRRTGHPHARVRPRLGRRKTRSRRQKKDTLLRELPKLPDLQCAWLLLSFCAAPRANHALRTVPPDLLAPYTAARDAAVWGTLQACLGATAEDEACPARDIALLPASLGGLGLSQATRTGPAAYWAAGADALSVLRERCPAFSDWAVRCLTDARGPACLRTASEARRLLVVEGWTDVPS